MPIRVNTTRFFVQGYRFARSFRTLIDLKWLIPTKFQTVPLGLKNRNSTNTETIWVRQISMLSATASIVPRDLFKGGQFKKKKILDITLTPFRQFISPSAIAVPLASGCSATVKDAGR
jgi:hypothetical protein